MLLASSFWVSQSGEETTLSRTLIACDLTCWIEVRCMQKHLQCLFFSVFSGVLDCSYSPIMHDERITSGSRLYDDFAVPRAHCSYSTSLGGALVSVYCDRCFSLFGVSCAHLPKTQVLDVLPRFKAEPLDVI